MARARVNDRRNYGERRQLTRRLDDRVGQVPDYIQDGQPLIRGTAAWNYRERARVKVGCRVKSFGEVIGAWNHESFD